MGIDIYASSGVVVTVQDFLKIINGKNKSDVIDACKCYYEDLKIEADDADESETWKKTTAEHYKPLSTLKTTMKLSEIREIIESTVQLYGEPSKYGQCGVSDSDQSVTLFSNIAGACPEAKKLPYIEDIAAWGSNRYNGHDVPKGVACVVFDSRDCFKRTLSKSGKLVEKLFGNCEESEWTEYSV